MNLPKPVAEAVRNLFDDLPLERAMPQLLPSGGASSHHIALVEEICSSYPNVGMVPALVAGLWLYVDELERSHSISQKMPDATGSFWHGIMHRREGDFPNSHFWFRNAGKHPAMELVPNYDGHEFIERVAADAGKNATELVDLQRQEWAALFSWCATQL